MLSVIIFSLDATLGVILLEMSELFLKAFRSEVRTDFVEFDSLSSLLNLSVG